MTNISLISAERTIREPVTSDFRKPTAIHPLNLYEVIEELSKRVEELEKWRLRNTDDGK